MTDCWRPAVLVETDGENETFYVREPGELIAAQPDRRGIDLLRPPRLDGSHGSTGS